MVFSVIADEADQIVDDSLIAHLSHSASPPVMHNFSFWQEVERTPLITEASIQIGIVEKNGKSFVEEYGAWERPPSNHQARGRRLLYLNNSIE
jgi:hypothetical protein